MQKNFSNDGPNTYRPMYERTMRQGGSLVSVPTLHCNWLAGDVVYPITISQAEVESGTRHIAEFYTPSGEPYSVAIDLAPGTAHGTQFVIVGAGGPAREGNGRGDLIVLVLVAA